MCRSGSRRVSAKAGCAAGGVLLQCGWAGGNLESTGTVASEESLGDASCWSGGFDYWRCCVQWDVNCFDISHTFQRCCGELGASISPAAQQYVGANWVTGFPARMTSNGCLLGCGCDTAGEGQPFSECPARARSLRALAAQSAEFRKAFPADCPSPVTADEGPVRLTFPFFKRVAQYRKGTCVADLVTDAYVCAKRAWEAGQSYEFNAYRDEVVRLAFFDGCLHPGSPALLLLRDLTVSKALGPSQCKIGMEQDDRNYAKKAFTARLRRGRGSADAKTRDESKWRLESPRVACLYPAVLPQEVAQLQAQGNSFASHCAWSKAFVAIGKDAVGNMENLAFPSIQVVDLRRHFEIPADGELAAGWSMSRDKVMEKFAFGNLVQKVLFMFLYTARHHLEDAEVFCRLDLDTVIIPENLKAYMLVNNVSEHHLVHLGKPNRQWQYTVGEFPDGGAGICLTQASLGKLGQLLEQRYSDLQNRPAWKSAQIEAIAQGIRSKQLPIEEAVKNCDFVPGHLDDAVLGTCFHELGIPCHGQGYDRFGRVFFGAVPMPCKHHWDAFRTTDFLWEEHLPPMWTSAYAWELAQLWVGELDRYVLCEPAHTLRAPFWWMASHAISFHEYKNMTLLLEAYEMIYGEGARAGVLQSGCVPLLRTGFTLRVATGSGSSNFVRLGTA